LEDEDGQRQKFNELSYNFLGTSLVFKRMRGMLI
jgi:hypothetical protein